jgi:hypothetical protein
MELWKYGSSTYLKRNMEFCEGNTLHRLCENRLTTSIGDKVGVTKKDYEKEKVNPW